MSYHIVVRFNAEAASEAIAEAIQPLYDEGVDGMFRIVGQGNEKMGRFHRETSDDFDYIYDRVRREANCTNWYDLRDRFEKAAIEQLVAEFEQAAGTSPEGLVGIVLAALKADTAITVNAEELVETFMKGGKRPPYGIVKSA